MEAVSNSETAKKFNDEKLEWRAMEVLRSTWCKSIEVLPPSATVSNSNNNCNSNSNSNSNCNCNSNSNSNTNNRNKNKNKNNIGTMMILFVGIT